MSKILVLIFLFFVPNNLYAMDITNNYVLECKETKHDALGKTKTVNFKLHNFTIEFKNIEIIDETTAQAVIFFNEGSSYAETYQLQNGLKVNLRKITPSGEVVRFWGNATNINIAYEVTFSYNDRGIFTYSYTQPNVVEVAFAECKKLLNE
jgi:hypothetical protein